jgi:hypothetical protein
VRNCIHLIFVLFREEGERKVTVKGVTKATQCSEEALPICAIGQRGKMAGRWALIASLGFARRKRNKRRRTSAFCRLGLYERKETKIRNYHLQNCKVQLQRLAPQGTSERLNSAGHVDERSRTETHENVVNAKKGVCKMRDTVLGLAEDKAV